MFIVMVCGLLLRVSSGSRFCRLLLLNESGDSSILDALELLYISARSYSPLRLPILSSNFDARMILTLLVCPNPRCQICNFLISLIWWVNHLHPVIIMTRVLILTCMIFLGITRSSINRLRFLLMYAIGRPSCIRNIEMSLSWYMILLSYILPSEMRFDLHSETRVIPSNLIFLPHVRAIHIIFTSSDCMI